MDGFEELEQEILYAKAETLGRMGQRLEEALAELRAFDGAEPGPPPGAVSREPAAPDPGEVAPGGGRGVSGPARERLLARAGEALLFYVVQRESMGLRADAELLDELGVPREVRIRMTLDPGR